MSFNYSIPIIIKIFIVIKLSSRLLGLICGGFCDVNNLTILILLICITLLFGRCNRPINELIQSLRLWLVNRWVLVDVDHFLRYNRLLMINNNHLRRLGSRAVLNVDNWCRSLLLDNDWLWLSIDNLSLHDLLLWPWLNHWLLLWCWSGSLTRCNSFFLCIFPHCIFKSFPCISLFLLRFFLSCFLISHT